MKYCSNCGHPMKESARFCEKCGTEFEVTIKDPTAEEYTYAPETNTKSNISRKGMWIGAAIFGVLTVFSAVMAATDDISMVALTGFCLPLTGMFAALAKSPRKSKYLFGTDSGIRKSLFVILCILLAFVLFSVLSDRYDLPEPLQSESLQQEEIIPDAYAPVIENIQSFLQGEDYDETVVPESYYLHWAKENGGPGSVGYRLVDLDKDGSDELLIGVIPSSDTDAGAIPEFWFLYTIRDGNAKLVTESWDRHRHYLGTDGYIYYAGSGGASATFESKMQFKDGDLYVLETAFTALDENEDLCYCYTDFGSGVPESAEEERRTSASAADRNDLSEEEWREIIEEWEYHREYANYLPLSEYGE